MCDSHWIINYCTINYQCIHRSGIGATINQRLNNIPGFLRICIVFDEFFFIVIFSGIIFSCLNLFRNFLYLILLILVGAFIYFRYSLSFVLQDLNKPMVIHGLRILSL